jgi:hypothetical protein
MADFSTQFQTPAVTMTDGMRAITDIQSVRVKVDVSDKIYQYDPNANALTLLLNKARNKRKTTQYLFHWLEKDRYPRFDAVNDATGLDADDTAMVVDDGTKFAKNMLLYLPATEERVYVTDVSGNTLTVTRGIGTTAKAIADNAQVEIVSSAYVEGGDVGDPKSTQEREVEQYTQIIRTPFAFSGRDANSSMYGGKDPATERRWQAVEHALNVEKAFWWGKKHSAVIDAGGKYTTFMNGVHAYVSDNVWDVNGIPFTERSLTEWLEYAMRYGDGGKMGNRRKFLFCSPRFITEIEMWAKERLHYHDNVKTYGLDAVTYRSAHGKIMLIEHPLFEEQGDIGFLLDLNHVRYCYHQGRDTKLLKGRGGNGIDGETEEFLSDVAVQVEMSAAHGFIKNLPL